MRVTGRIVITAAESKTAILNPPSKRKGKTTKPKRYCFFVVCEMLKTGGDDLTKVVVFTGIHNDYD